MSDSLGLSVGTANFVAARVGGAPVTHRSVLTLFGHRAPEVGVPEDNPNLTESGLVLRGFVERVGDPAPLVADDGSTHRSDALIVEALDAMALTVGYGAPVAIAVPAHWAQNVVATLREALRAKPALAPDVLSPTLISDATAALAALYAKPGFPTDGVVALCDFGAGATNVTLTDAASNFQHIGQTVRYTDFSGDQIDRAILRHVQADVTVAGNTDSPGTSPVGSLNRRLDECRRAKEQLSAATVTVIPAEMPGFGKDVRLSRKELQELISGPLEQFVSTVIEILQRNGIPADRLAAIATVGGGACIPLITERLSDRLRTPVVTTPQPALSAAIGAAVLADHRSSAAPTGMAPAPTAPANIDAPEPIGFGAGPTDMDAGAPTDMAPSAWAGDMARAAAGESADDGAQSATYRALAWSQDPSAGDEPVPYTGEDDSSDYAQSPAGADTAVKSEPADHGGVAAAEPRRHKRPLVLFGLAAAAAGVVLLGAVLTVKLTATSPTPTDTAPTRVTAPGEPSSPGPPPTTQPPTTTTTQPPTTTTTQPPTTTTTTTTTQPPTTTTTTTQPPTTTTAEKTTNPQTTAAAPSTTATKPAGPTLHLPPYGG